MKVIIFFLIILQVLIFGKKKTDMEKKDLYNDRVFTTSIKEHDLQFWSKENNCTLIVNGKDITQTTSVYYSGGNSIYLPFVAIMKNLGGIINWKSESYAEIEFFDDVYILDLELHLICNKDTKEPLFIYPPGGGYCCEIEALLEKDVIINPNFLPIIFDVNINVEENIVYVTRV